MYIQIISKHIPNCLTIKAHAHQELCDGLNYHLLSFAIFRIYFGFEQIFVNIRTLNDILFVTHVGNQKMLNDDRWWAILCMEENASNCLNNI